ncbi:hypothetical protein D3C87_1612470 [compost metagenome]
MKIIPFTKRTVFGTFKPILWHSKAKEEISTFPEDVKRDLGYLLYLLQIGEGLSMPHSRPMRTVGSGVAELRVRGKDSHYRAFYLQKTNAGILVFHAFVKKTQATAMIDINLGRKRLSELLEDLDG